MSSLTHNCIKISLTTWFAALLFLASASPAQFNLEDNKPSIIDAMVRILLDNDTHINNRLTHARALLQSPNKNYHQALVNILQAEDNLVSEGEASARIIICQAIASQNNGYFFSANQPPIPEIFISPLFKAMKSDDPVLSFWAAQALVKCRDGVPGKLAQIASDPVHILRYRLAAISALELLPGTQPVKVLAQLLDDKEPDIKNRAAQALRTILHLPAPLNIPQFQKKQLPLLLKIDEEAFLHWQLEQHQTLYNQSQQQINRNRKIIAQWRDKYLLLLTKKFQQITESENKIKELKSYLLSHTSDDAENIWAMRQIVDWTDTAELREGKNELITAALVELLTGFISNDNPQIRQLTAQALENLVFYANTSLDTAPILLKQLAHEDHPDAQAALLAALGTFDYLPAANQALKLFRHSHHIDVIIQASRALGRISDSNADSISKILVENIIAAMALGYNNSMELFDQKQVTVIRQKLIPPINKISSHEAFQLPAKKHFKDIMTSALDDNDSVIRSQAIYVLTKLYRKNVLPILLDNRNLLNDEENQVRDAVIAALKSYGSKEHLKLLRQRLDKESNLEVAKRIRNAFTEILTTQPLEDTYSWAKEFENTNPDSPSLLHQEIISLLSEKINLAQKAGITIETKYELLVFSHQGIFAEKSDLYAQALLSYKKILNLDLLESDKNKYRQKIMDLALQDENVDTLIEAQPVVKTLILRSSFRPETLDKIKQACNQLDSSVENQLLRQANIINIFVAPVFDSLSQEDRQYWKKRNTDIALKLIAQQLKRIGENDSENFDIIKLLLKIDPRLKDYPAREAPLNERLRKLKSYQQILTLSQSPASNTKKPAN